MSHDKFRELAGEHVIHNARYIDTPEGEYIVAYHGQTYSSSCTSDLADRIAEVMREEAKAEEGRALTVRELIEQLSICNPNAEVIINIPAPKGPAFAGLSLKIRECFAVTNQHPVLITDATTKEVRETI